MLCRVVLIVTSYRTPFKRTCPFYNRVVTVLTPISQDCFDTLSSFFIRIYFIRISGLKFAKVCENFKNKPQANFF